MTAPGKSDAFRRSDGRRNAMTAHSAAKRSISEAEFARICEGIAEDADSIVRHNPIGTREEILLWMLMSCLVSYLSLEEVETPCFNGVPDAATYREAIRFIVTNRSAGNFDIAPYLETLAKQ
jgi:hypothetical protein